MAINVQSAYNGQVLNKILIKATTGNELVERGLICIKQNVKGKFHIPRLKAGKFLQKVKENPVNADSKGNFDYTEKTLEPKEFMAFTTFNPKSFLNIWEEYAVRGELVYAELPSHVQNKLLEALSSSVDFELGDHFINGQWAESGDDKLMNGILTRILAESDVIKPTVAQGAGIEARLKAVYKAIPKALRKSKDLKIIMSMEDLDAYDDYLTSLSNKGEDPTKVNVARYKNIPIEALAAWPENVILATVASLDENSNLWAAVNLINDFSTIKIAPLTNAGELYFFKMKMMADTQIAFGEECILLDTRASGLATRSVQAPKQQGSTVVDKNIDTNPVVTGGEGDDEGGDSDGI